MAGNAGWFTLRKHRALKVPQKKGHIPGALPR
jgi:hypothetical protein